jgi:hypothetical protein
MAASIASNLLSYRYMCVCLFSNLIDVSLFIVAIKHLGFFFVQEFEKSKAITFYILHFR